MLIHKLGKKYYIWDNLNAEEAVKNQVLTPDNATISFKRLQNAIKWANENDETEYGYQINNLRKPKDGFMEDIKLCITKTLKTPRNAEFMYDIYILGSSWPKVVIYKLGNKIKEFTLIEKKYESSNDKSS